MILMATHKNLTLYFKLIVLSTFGADSHKGQASLNLRVAKDDLLLLAPILLAQQPLQCLAFGSVVSPGLTEANGTAWEARCFLYNDHHLPAQGSATSTISSLNAWPIIQGPLSPSTFVPL